MTAISHILASTSEIRIDGKADPHHRLSHLKKGQIVEATVQQSPSPRRAHLLIQGHTVSARAYFPLKPGQTILLKVTDTHPQPVFKLVASDGGNMLNISRGLVEALCRPGPYGLLAELAASGPTEGDSGKNAFASRAIGDLTGLLKSLAMHSERVDHRFLRTLIRGGGMLWEQKLAAAVLSDRPISNPIVETDLKGLALQLLFNAPEATSDAADDIQEFVERIERIQLLNSHIARGASRYLLPIPMLFHDHLKFGQALIDLGKDPGADSEKTDRMIRVSLLLDMSNMGHVQADLSILKTAMTGSLVVESNTVREVVEPHLPRLIHKLQMSGFNVYEFTCSVMELGALTADPLVERLIDSGEGLLHLII